MPTAVAERVQKRRAALCWIDIHRIDMMAALICREPRKWSAFLSKRGAMRLKRQYRAAKRSTAQRNASTAQRNA